MEKTLEKFWSDPVTHFVHVNFSSGEPENDQAMENKSKLNENGVKQTTLPHAPKLYQFPMSSTLRHKYLFN